MPCSDYADISLQAVAVLIMDQTMNIPTEQFQLKTSLKFVMPTEQRQYISTLLEHLQQLTKNSLPKQFLSPSPIADFTFF